MKTIKNFLITIDLFAVPYSFRYKEKEKFGTSIGGFFIVLIFIMVLVMGIYYFIPFINRKNYTIVYYTMNLASTEEVNIFDSDSNIAVGLTCDSKKGNIYNYLDLRVNFVQYEKFRNGSYGKVPKPISVGICDYGDFYNKFDKQFDYLGIKDFYCVKSKDYTIQGIYADQIFSYYEFTAVAKNSSDDLLDKIESFLFGNDCKLQFVYTDIIIDLDNYEEPVAQYLDVIFIQLDPTLFIKRNIYFRNQYFTDDNLLMFVFGDDEEPEIKPLFSRYEEYSLYKGLNRSEKKPEEYQYYSKVYVRADLKKTIIKRRYQKFMEFYADSSSLLIAIYEILYIIFNYIDTFYAHHSLAQEIFFFKDLKNEDSFNVFQRSKDINEIISLTDLQKEKEKSSELGLSLIKAGNYKDMKNTTSNKIESPKVKKKGKKKRNVKIYNNKNISSSNEKSKELFKTNRQLKEKNSDKESEYNIEFGNFKINKIDRLGNYGNSGAILNFKSKAQDENKINESLGTNVEEPLPNNEKSKTNKNNDIKVSNSFNIFEIIITQFLKCFMTKNMRIKNNSNEKANSLLFSKMDINCYVRNMILFDILNQTILNDNKKDIINFLCRPVICCDKKDNNFLADFYRKYEKEDFNKFSENIRELVAQSKKDDRELRVISISNEHLKAFI